MYTNTLFFNLLNYHYILTRFTATTCPTFCSISLFIIEPLEMCTTKVLNLLYKDILFFGYIVKSLSIVCYSRAGILYSIDLKMHPQGVAFFFEKV